MRNFFQFFAERNLLAYIITGLIITLGLATLPRIKRDIFPDVTLDEMLISTSYPGASPEDVELNVTNKLEKEIKTVVGVKKYLSFSRENASLIWVQLEADIKDKDKVKDEIREAVNRVTDLPAEVRESPLITEIDSSVFPIVEVGLVADMPYPELRELARRFQKRLENVPGVAKVEPQGLRDREVRIEVLPKAMERYEISLPQIINAIRAHNIRATGGTLESYTDEKNIVTLSQFEEPADVEDVIVQSTFYGPVVKISDIGEVIDGYEEEKIRTRINGRDGISFVAYKSSTADIIRTVNAIKAMVETESQGLLSGVEVLYSNDSSKYIKNRLDTVMLNGLLGLLFVAAVLSIFLNLRAAFWVAMGIPIAILGTIFLLPLFGAYLDGISLMAMVIVIGIIVDDAIIVSENIYRRYELGDSPLEASVNGVTGVFKPVMTTIMTTFIAFAPMFFVPGTMGKFIYVIPLVISLALFISIVESTLALPAHLAPALKSRNALHVTHGENFFEGIRARFKKILQPLLKLRYLVVLVFVAVLIGTTLYAKQYMEFVLFPTKASERISVYVTLPIGNSLQATSDKVREIEAVIEALPVEELESFTTKVGTYGGFGASTRENAAVIGIYLTPYSTRVRTAEMIIEELKEKTGRLGEFEEIVFRAVAGGPPVGDPVEVRVVGGDDLLRKQLADSITEFLKAYDGVQDVERDDREGKQRIRIVLDYTALARAGLTVEDVARNVRVAFDGEIVTDVRYGDEDVDFRVTMRKSDVGALSHLQSLKVPNKTGRLIQLDQVAELEIIPGMANYNHYNGERAIEITGDIDKSKTSPLSVAASLREKFAELEAYPGVRLIVGGEAEETAKAQIDLSITFGIAILGIYALLILLFNSLQQPILVLLTIPFGMVGVIITFLLHGEQLGFLAVTGMIGMSGVVVNDALVLVNHINELRNKQVKPVLFDVVIEATGDRLRAILITTISTVVGLLPLAYGIGGEDPNMAPMALALGYGLLFATPLTLVLVPCLYLVGDDIRRFLSKLLSSVGLLRNRGFSDNG